MRPQKQLRVVKIVKVVHRVSRAELDPLDLLEIDIKHLLHARRDSAEPDPVEGLSQRVPELAVEKGRHGGVVHRVVPLLGGVVHHAPPVHQHHKLVGVHMDH